MTDAMTEDPDAGRRSDSGGRPNLAHEAILEAFAENPSKAAVARLLDTNERHVRRVLNMYPDFLRAAQRRVQRERREQKQARESRLEAWAESRIEGLLERLDSLAASDNEVVAFRSIKLQLEVAMQIRSSSSADILLALADAEDRLLDPLQDAEARDDLPAEATST